MSLAVLFHSCEGKTMQDKRAGRKACVGQPSDLVEGKQ